MFEITIIYIVYSWVLVTTLTSCWYQFLSNNVRLHCRITNGFIARCHKFSCIDLPVTYDMTWNCAILDVVLYNIQITPDVPILSQRIIRRHKMMLSCYVLYLLYKYRIKRNIVDSNNFDFKTHTLSVPNWFLLSFTQSLKFDNH